MSCGLFTILISGSFYMIKKIVLWIFVILTCAMIFNFSSKVGNNSFEQSEAITKKVENVVTQITDKESSYANFERVHKFIRKQGHFIEFAILGIFVFLLVRCYDFSMKKSLIIALSFILFYAATDEIHQLFVEGRMGRIKDVFIDFFGGIVGMGIVYPFEIKKLKKQTKKL